MKNTTGKFGILHCQIPNGEKMKLTYLNQLAEWIEVLDIK